MSKKQKLLEGHVFRTTNKVKVVHVTLVNPLGINRGRSSGGVQAGESFLRATEPPPEVRSQDGRLRQRLAAAASPNPRAVGCPVPQVRYTCVCARFSCGNFLHTVVWDFTCVC